MVGGRSMTDSRRDQYPHGHTSHSRSIRRFHECGRKTCATSLIVLLAATVAGGSENWPRFRGPGALGVSDNPDLPDTWSSARNVLWKTRIAGRGWSSPVVWGDRVFVTSVIDEGESEEPKKGLYFGGNRLKPPTTVHQWKVFCLDLDTGRILWERLAHQGAPPEARHLKNSYSSETPVTDGQHVYVYFGNLGVFCYTLDGTLTWSKELPARRMRFGWGTAASPILHNDRLYLVNDNEEESYLVALDKETGKQVWRTERDEKSNWATPYVWENELRTEIITPGTGKVRSYDLQGKLLYEFGGCSSITIATPYSKFGLLYVSSGYILDKRRPVFAIRPGATGDISLSEGESSNEYIAWSQKEAAPYNPSTIVYGDILYVLHDRGFLASYDAKTGKKIYAKQRLPKGRAFTASPWAAGGKIFCVNEYGVTFVVRAGRRFELLHTNVLGDDDMCMATPAMAGDRLILRTASTLYCFEREADAR